MTRSVSKHLRVPVIGGIMAAAAIAPAWGQQAPDPSANPPPLPPPTSALGSTSESGSVPGAATTPGAATAPGAATTPGAATSTTASSPDPEDLPPAGEPGSIVSPLELEPPRPPTVDEVEAPGSFDEQLARLEKELEYYRSGAESYAEDMRALLRQKYDRQRELLAAQYDRRIEELETNERLRRLEAIARFEEFLRKYPNDPIYTPDAMFRLAELHFEKSSDDYLRRSEGYEAELIAFEEGRRETEPDAPEPSYEKTIGLHRDLLARFPEYRLADAARYLLGYCYGEQGQSDEALLAYLELTRLHPNSEFLAEVWTRVGEIYFDGSSTAELEQAVAAYTQVLDYPDSPYYDKALYKIAWTYYRLDRFDDAVGSFVALVNYADEQKRLTGVTGSELRTEAIQYIAISLSDEEWGGLERARTVLGPLEKEAYVGELWKQYGDILFDQTRYPLAIQVLEYALNKYPNAAYNPEVQEKIVRAYEAQRDFNGATNAREELVAAYSEGSSWYEANRQEPDVITKAESLTERSLYTAAIFRHQQAQADKRAGRAERARTQYLAAADSYKDYLKRFPHSKNAYDFEFFLAECLYYSDQYMSAAKQYDAVRDSKLDNKHLEAAALSAVIAYEKEVEAQEKAGRLPDYPLQTAAQREKKNIAPRQVAPLRQELIGASDRFATLLPQSPRAPAIRYRAAEIFYRHDQFDEARRRFEEVVQTYPASEVAQYSSNLIIESYLAAEDWQSVEEWSQRLIELAQNAPEPATDPGSKKDFIASLRTFKVGAQFKRAQDFDAAGKFEAAANTYVRLVDEDPQNEFADKALFNAAVAYEKVNRFDTATQIYGRLHKEYAKSELAPRALFRVGINAEKSFDFPHAIEAYATLVERYPDSDKRADALYNEAVVLENMQRYREAAQAYVLYAKTFPKRDDAGDIFFRAAVVYEKMKDWTATVDTLRQFVQRYGRQSKYAEKVIESLRKTGAAHEAKGNVRLAQNAYRDCVRAFSARRLSVQSRAARFAAQCAFQRAEARFARYDELSITGSGRRQIKALTAKAKSQRAVEKAYQRVFRYKRAEQTLAASYRIGYSYERFAESLFAAPIPREFEKDEELANEYRAQLEERAAVLERKAESAYRKAYAEAKRTNLTNEWTQRILESLNKYAPSEFPIQKAGKAELQTTMVSGFGLDDLQSEPQSRKVPGASRTPTRVGPRTARAGGQR